MKEREDTDYSDEATPFTREGFIEEMLVAHGPVNQSSNRGISSAVERRFHTAEVVGAAPASPTTRRTPQSLPTKINASKFWAKVERWGNDECWLWRGALNSKGYGCLGIGGKRWLAHRIAYALSKGEPGRLIIRHSCDNPRCCNPAHLLSGTHQDNSADAASRGRLAYGEKNGRAKITQEIADYIRRNPLDTPVCDLAVLHGLNEWTVRAIQRGELWSAPPDGRKRG